MKLSYYTEVEKYKLEQNKKWKVDMATLFKLTPEQLFAKLQEFFKMMEERNGYPKYAKDIKVKFIDWMRAQEVKART